jgi:hypothetical protein
MFRIGILLNDRSTKGKTVATKQEADEFILYYMEQGTFKRAYIKDLDTNEQELIQ